ncbi:Steryl-sulfatase [Portunus trituberculatus]|uniref:Steryl-sulfatase n=1 Tax=Portunus trituberculatus TaxID=210409 RepID=A0A5B7K056_PORTR|nr:Steryl-sulfatase [Portunus trituberculatus]
MNRHLNGVLMEDGVVLQQPLILEGLSQQMASHSAGLIAKYAREEQPFFLYHSFAHVHTPMFTVPQMAGRSAQGRYGDNVEEMDAAVGEILAALHEHNLEDNTIVYFVSDHGAHLEAIDEDGQRSGGFNGLFKGVDRNSHQLSGMSLTSILLIFGSGELPRLKSMPTNHQHSLN